MFPPEHRITTTLKMNFKRSINDWIEIVNEKPSPLFVAMVGSVACLWMVSAIVIFMPSFQGMNPVPGDWKCVSDKCSTLNISTLEQLCDQLFTEKSITIKDIAFQPQRKTFSVDFTIFCKIDAKGYAKKTLISSMYFAGGLLGLMISGFCFDNFGRKVSVLVGGSLTSVASFIGFFCKNYELLLFIRFMQGFGNLVATIAVYIWGSEMVPSRFRNYFNGYIGVVWSLGYPIVAALGYLIKDWNFQFLAVAVSMLLATIPAFFMIESPRFYAIKKDVTNIQSSIQKLAHLNGVKIDVATVDLLDLEVKREQSAIQQLKDFIQYPVLIFEALIQMITWFMVAMSFYGFNFGWGRLVPNVYLGYVISGACECVTHLLHVGFVQAVGRRRSMIIILIGAVGAFLVSIIDFEIGNKWTIESISSLVGIVFISSAFGGIYLYSSELAPTSHRGLVFAMSSGSARIGSFLGPFVINNLDGITHKAVPFCILSFLGVISITGMLFLVETNDKEIPAVPADVHERRKYFKLRL